MIGRFGLVWAMLVCGCGAASTDAPGDVDAGTPDAGALDASIDDAAVVVPDASSEDAAAASLDAGVDGGPEECTSDACTTPPRYEVEMTWATVNVGRNYDTRGQVAAVIDGVGDALVPKSGPSFIGWQEIGEGDPCGSCEIELIRARFTDSGYRTSRPAGTRPDGGSERVKVPVSSRGAEDGIEVRAVFASPGWAGVSPTRFVTVSHHPLRNLSFINTHFIAGAWSCASERERRRTYWRRAWQTLKEEVAREHDAGRNVIVTGDLNRPRGENGCNPAWDPTSLHPSSRVIGGAGIDYVFAVPADSWSFRYVRRADDSIARGTIHLGIDGHSGHWVRGRFEHDE